MEVTGGKRLPVVGFLAILMSMTTRLCLGQAPDIMAVNLQPDASNPLVYENIPTTLKFQLEIKNDGAAGNDIGALTSGQRNYAVDFYFAYSDVSVGDITGTTNSKMTNTGTPPALDFPLAALATSVTLTYEVTGTLPTASCGSYGYFCACVKAGANAAYTDADPTNNCNCYDARGSDLISCKPDIKILGANLTPDPSNPVALMNTATPLKFNVKIDNADTTNIVGALATGKQNYEVEFYFTKADVSNIGPATSKVQMTNTGTLPALNFGLGTSAVSAILTFETLATLPIALCNSYTHFCACVKKGADAIFTDNVPTNNCGCTGVTTKISCADIKPNTFTLDTNNPIAVQSVEVTLKFSLKMENIGAAPATIDAVAAGLRNYAATFYFSIANLATAPSSLNKVALTNTLEPADLYFTLSAGASGTALNFEAKGTLPSANCNNYGYICVCVGKGAAAAYSDNPSNNCACIVSTDLLISCFPDIKAEAFAPNAGTYPEFIVNTAVNFISFTFNIKNNAAALLGNNIVAPTPAGDNFAIDVYFAQDDLNTNQAAPRSTAFAATADSAGDVQVKLDANTLLGDKVFTANGMVLPSTDCNLFKYVCACVKKGSAGEYVDAVTTNNCRCDDASSTGAKKISCFPDITPTNLVLSGATPSSLLEGKPTEVTAIKVDIKNAAAVASGNDIFDAVPNTKLNYAVDVYFAKVDLKTSSTGAKSAAFTATLTGGDLSKGITAGSTTATGTLVFKSSVTLPTTDCNLYTYFCVCVKKGADAKYIDSVTTNNCECSQTLTFTCHPDVQVTAFTFDSNPVFPQSENSDVGFTISIKNIGTTASEDIKTITVGTAPNDETFHPKITQTDINVAAQGAVAPSGDCQDRLGITPLFVPTGTTAPFTIVILDSPNEVYNGLLSQTSLNMKGTLKAKLDTTKCPDINYLCVNINMKDALAPPSPPYSDRNLDNNCLCTDISAYKTCEPDVKVTAFTGFPDSSNVMIGTAGMTGLAFTVTLKNIAPAVSGNDIRQATGTDINYNFIGYYSKTDATITAALATRFTINLSTTDLQSGLDATKTSTFSGTIDYPALAKANCASDVLVYACIYVSPDNRANGGTFVDNVKANNFKCYQIIQMCRPDPKPTNLLLHTPATISADTLTAIEFSVDVGNAQANDPMLVLTGSLTHFKVLLKFSDVNLGTTSLDTLNLGTISTTFPNIDDNKVAITSAGGMKTLGTTGKRGTASVNIPVAKCDKVTFLCALLYPSDNARYVDLSTEQSPNVWTVNTTCLDVSTKLVCHPDIEVTALTFGTGAVFPMLDATADVDFEVTFTNIRPKDIAAITSGSDENFHIKFKESDINFRVTPSPNYNSLTTTDSTNVEVTAADTTHGLLGLQSLSMKGKIKFGLDKTGTKCNDLNFLCINVEPKGTPYVDSDLANNWFCVDVKTMKTCSPDLAIDSFTKFPNPGDPGPMIGTVGMASQTLILTLKNVATSGSGNDIIQATGASDVNYAFTGYYASADGGPTAATSDPASFTINLSANDLRSELNAVGTKTFTGTISYPALSKTNCVALMTTSTPYACLHVKQNNVANGGTFIDQDAANNHKCEAITLTCRPDPKPKELTLAPGASFEPDVATAITFSIKVTNVATGSNDNLPSVTGSNTHFKFELQFSDVNLGTTLTGSALSGRFSSTITVIPENQVDINVGITKTLGGIKATVTLSEALCPNVKYLCAILLLSADAKFVDASREASPADFRADTTCLDISLLKTCHPDVEVTAFSEPNNVIISLNSPPVAVTIPFEVTVKNNDADINIGPKTLNTEENFHLKFVLSNANVAVSGVNSNTLLIPAFENVDVTVTPPDDVRLGLQAGQSLTLKGSVKVTMPNDATKCAATRQLCVNSDPKNAYTEDQTRLLNNWKCKDISNQISCGIDVEIVSFNSIPTAADPLVGDLGKSGVAFTLNIRNRVSGGQGKDIAAVASPNKNFVVTSFYSSADAPSVVVVGTANTLTIADSALRVALPGTGTGTTGATTSISGTIDYSVLSTGGCPNAKFTCMKILEVAGQSSYTELAATLTTPGPNTKCYPLDGLRSCAPDPKPNTLDLKTDLAVGSTTLASFDVKLQNTKATAANQDAIYTAVAPNYNYKFELQLSDVNMGVVGIASDTLGLAKISTTFSDAELRLALAVNPDITLTTGEASIPLDAAACPKVQWLCIFLSKGTGAAYVDSDLNNNIECADIIAKKGCTPDPAIVAWSVSVATPLPLVYVQEVWQQLTVKLDLKNLASGSKSNIGTAVSPSWNYRVIIKFTDKDLASTISTTNSSDFGYAPAGDLKSPLPAGGGALSLAGTVLVALPKATCTKLNFLCAIMHHNNLEYNDKNTVNNVKCIDITTMKVCSPDTDITLFTDNPKTQSIKDNVNPASPVPFIFDVTWKNVANAFPGNDILDPPTTPVNSENFKFQMTFSDVNLGLGQTDTLAIAKTAINIPHADLVDPLKAQTGSITKMLTVPASDKLVIPPAKCANVKFVCLYIEEGTNAQYADAVTTNNVECLNIDIAAAGPGSKKNCRPAFTNLDGSVDMNENTATGVSIFKVTASQGDQDVPNALFFTIDSPATPPFAIDTSTGEVKTLLTGGSVFDYETVLKQYKLVIKVTDGTTPADPAYSPTATLTVNIKDVNEAPSFNPSTVTVAPAVPERMAKAVYTMTVVDPDLPPQTMSYSIEINPTVTPGAPFYIQSTGLYTDGVISVSAPGLDFEAASTYSLTVHMTDMGTPPLTANPLALVIVPVSDVPDPPFLKNLPDTISLSEAVANTYNTPIYTIVATDQDTDPLLYYINVEPNDGKIILEETNKIKYKANPDFDHETVPEYTVTIIVRDGANPPVDGVLTIKILNSTYGDLPIIDVTTWPSSTSITIPEDQALLAYFYDVKALDPDGRNLKYSLDQVPYTSPGKFAIDPKGRVYSVVNPGFDFETQAFYDLTINVCGSANCTSRSLKVNIVDKNDDPVCTPGALEVSSREGSYAPGQLFLATDQDGDTITYAKITTTKNQNLFIINTAGIISVDNLNYDTLYSRVFGSFEATDSKGAKCTFDLTVNIIDTNADPKFINEPYSGSINEDNPTDTSIMTVEATDSDIGVNSILSFEVIPDADKAEDNFKLKKLSGTNRAVVLVQSPKDRESMPGDIMKVKIRVRDGGGATDTSTVTVTVNNVNDNKPTFTQELYNFEMMYNDTKGHVLGSVLCTDKDVAYNIPSYNWLDDLMTKNFTVDASTGSVASAITPLTPNKQYVLLVECRDNDPVKQDTSLTHVVRVDTYYGWEVVTNWTTTKPPAYYDVQAKLDNFLAGASALCAPSCVAKLHSRYTTSAGYEVLAVYFLKDPTTDNIGNIGKKKEFISATDIMGAYTTDRLKTPASSVTASTILSAHGITSIVRYRDAPNDINFMLDTIGGNMLIGMLMFIGEALILTAVVCIARKAFPLNNYKSQRLDSPSRPYSRRQKTKVAPSPQPPRRELTADSVASIATVSNVNFASRPIPLQNRPPPSTKASKQSNNYNRAKTPPKAQHQDIDPPNDLFKEANRKVMSMKEIQNSLRRTKLDY